MKKFSLVAILLSVFLFFSCSNPVAKAAKGGFSFQLDEVTVTAFANQVKQAKVANTVARTADGDITDVVEVADIPADSDFYNQVSPTGINLVITDKKGKEVASCFEPWTEESQVSAFTFEELNLYQPYTVSAYFKVANTSIYYGSGSVTLKSDDETEKVSLKLKSNDVISSPLVKAKGSFDTEQTEKSTKCFGVVVTPVSFANEADAAKFTAADFLQIGYVDSYPATISLAFPSNCTARVFDANGAIISADVKSADGEKFVDFVLNDGFSTNYMIVTAEDAETGLFASTYVTIIKDYAPVNPLKTDYILFNKMDPKGIWLVNDLPASDDTSFTEKPAYAGSTAGNFNSYMSFDEEGGLWYVGENNNLYRNGVDVGWTTLMPTLKAFTMSYDIVEDYLYLLAKDQVSGKALLVKIDAKGKAAADFKLTEESIIGISETSLFKVLGVDSIYRFCADSGKIFVASGDGAVFLMDSYDATKPTSSFDIYKHLNAGGLWISDLIVKDNVLYVLVSQCWNGRGVIYQRGGVVSFVYEDNVLALNEPFGNKGVYGWTDDEEKIAINENIWKGELYGPNDPDSQKMFGQSTFVGIQPGRLVFSDVGAYFTKTEDGRATTADIKRIMVLDLSTQTSEIKHTSATFALDDTTVQNSETLYSFLKSLRQY